MRKRINTGFIILLLILPGISIAQISDDVFFAKANNLTAKNDSELALKTLLQANASLEEPSTKIGIAFIELVTEKELNSFYEAASHMYMWGLSAKNVSPNTAALKEEIERLRVLVDDDVYRHWRKLLKQNDAQLYSELTQFWQQKDPTPTTAKNERLIEHWQRITYSRKHFTKSNQGSFGADERAKIYVKYGAPDLKRDGNLEFNESEAMQYAEQMTQQQSGFGSSDAERRYVRKAREYHRDPEYEIWIYAPSKLQKEELFFIFGSARGVTAGFDLVDTVADFIPQVADKTLIKTLTGGRTDLGITPGLLLQVMYYDQLTPVHPSFASKRSAIINRTTFGESSSPWLAQQIRSQSRSEAIYAKSRAPEEISTNAEAMQEIPLEVYQYRLLDEENQPYFATFVEGNPHGAFLYDYFENYSNGKKEITQEEIKGNNKLKYYDYAQSIQLYNSNSKQVAELHDQPTIAVGKNDVSQSLFTVPAVTKGTRQVFEAQLKNTDPSSSYAVDSLAFSPDLRGLGSTIVHQPAPLDNDKSSLQMGDLIVGYNYADSLSNPNRLPFTIANNRKIPAGKEMAVHVEIYHLPKNADGNYNATLTYQIIPDENWVADLFTNDNEALKLTLNLESEHARYVENLRIKTRELKHGSYTLQMVARHSNGQQKITRKFEFEVVENDKE